jgi:succinate-semialdehyde dehydrogenase/glutarate-semialdehyde dehydrogenase
MLALAAIMEEAGLPKGVLNVFVSSSSGKTVAPLLADPRLRKLSFTGSTEVGQMLVRDSATRLLRISMELGGNAPFLVFADADIDAAVDGAMLAKMRNGGEACTSANRFYVHDSVHDQFVAKLTARMAGLKVGRGVDAGVDLGPLIDESQRSTVRSLVEDAVGRGAQAGGGSVDRDRGYFYAPTVLSEVAPDSRILQEEIFGPVAPVVRFTDDDAAIAAANDTDYGLVAYVFTRDTKKAFNVIERLETGMVGLNQGIVSNAAAPFGGVKLSGYGREGGAEGIDEYLYTKYAALNV